MLIVCPHCQQEFDYIPFNGEDGPLRAARKEKQLTVNQAAEAVGVSPWTLQRLEQGKGDPRIGTIRRFVKLYGKPADELFPVSDDIEASDGETPETAPKEEWDDIDDKVTEYIAGDPDAPEE